MSSEMGSSRGGRLYPSVEEVFGKERTVSTAESGDDDRVWVAVGKDVKEGKDNLMWVAKNFQGKRICIFHVFQPSQLLPFSDGNFSLTRLKVMDHQNRERQIMQQALKKYLAMLQDVGSKGEAFLVGKDSVKEGIVEHIALQRIKRLVIGAATNKQYKKNMVNIKSETALYVHDHALESCHIWFVCKGHLVKRREAVDESGMLHRISSSNFSESMSVSDVSSVDDRQWLDSPQSSSIFMQDTSDLSWKFRPSSSQSSFGSGSFNISSYVPSAPTAEVCPPEENNSEFGVETSSQYKEAICNSSPPSVLETATDEEMYERIDQAMAEADIAKREAFEELLKRRKAEKEAFDAGRRAKEAERKYHEELRLRKKIEDAISREKLELERMSNEQLAVMEELNNALSQKSSLESEIADSKKETEELQEKIVCAVELLTSYRDERDKLEFERDRSLRAAEELRQQAESLSLSVNLPQYFSEFSYSEIENATRHFHPSLKIGEGEYRSIYKGVLRYTDVAVKILQPNSMQGPSEYRQEVEVLSRLRHPNIVTLIGACPEAFTLIYEYLPNGSLKDRLECKENSSPLSWQTRIRIAAELCSVLIFLHSSKSHCIVHSDLNPSNILLDANFISKLSGFGMCYAITPGQSPTIKPAVSYKTYPFLDPEFVTTGEMTPQSDIYSLGIILLMLLTGKEAMGITSEVQRAIENGTLHSLLDCSAGDWPYVQAQQIAHLALRCAATNRKERPNLESEVLRVLEPMMASCRGSSISSRLGDEENSHAPPYFICPIFQEVMQDPHVAADGFTYEAEAIRGWLESGHNTSPMTNVQLAHNNLVPNHALRSAIQEWLQQKPQL